jgi:hypothetical protein
MPSLIRMRRFGYRLAWQLPIGLVGVGRALPASHPEGRLTSHTTEQIHFANLLA